MLGAPGHNLVGEDRTDAGKGVKVVGGGKVEVEQTAGLGAAGTGRRATSASTPTRTCSPSATLRARLSTPVATPGSTPPAARSASSTRAPTRSRTSPGRPTLPATSTTSSGPLLLRRSPATAGTESGCSDGRPRSSTTPATTAATRATPDSASTPLRPGSSCPDLSSPATEAGANRIRRYRRRPHRTSNRDRRACRGRNSLREGRNRGLGGPRDGSVAGGRPAAGVGGTEQRRYARGGSSSGSGAEEHPSDARNARP